MYQRQLLFGGIVALFLLEIFSLTLLRKQIGIYTGPMVYLLAAGGGVLLTMAYLAKSRELKPAPTKAFPAVPVAMAIGASVLAWLVLRPNLVTYPVDPTKSDIIPLVEILVKRCLQGTPVYNEINDFGYTMYPNYLPLTWGSFIFPEWLGMDYRAWAFLAFSFMVALLLIALRKQATAVVPLLIIGVLLLFFSKQPDAFGWTIEPLNAGFYLLLAAAVFSKRPLLLAVALTCCLLSRYAILPAIPFLFLCWWWYRSRTEAIRVAIGVVTGIVLLFVLPFLLQQPSSLLKGYQYYTMGAVAEWKGQSWQASGDLPFQLSQGYGVAIWFYKVLKGSIAEKVAVLQKVHALLCLLLPLTFTVWYQLKGKSFLSLSWFLLLMLKAYLVVFFSFIQVPYGYLFLTPLLVSAFVMALLLAHHPWQQKSPDQVRAL